MSDTAAYAWAFVGIGLWLAWTAAFISILVGDARRDRERAEELDAWVARENAKMDEWRKQMDAQRQEWRKKMGLPPEEGQ